MRTPQAILALLAIGACGIPALAQQKWTAYRYPDQGFSIAFPGEPRLAAKPLAGKYPLTQHDYLFATGNNVFEVTVLEYADGHGPDKVDTAHLSGLIASYVRGSGSTLRTQNLWARAGRRPRRHAGCIHGRASRAHHISGGPKRTGSL